MHGKQKAINRLPICANGCGQSSPTKRCGLLNGADVQAPGQYRNCCAGIFTIYRVIFSGKLALKMIWHNRHREADDIDRKNT
jgi:hypothetical protein